MNVISDADVQNIKITYLKDKIIHMGKNSWVQVPSNNIIDAKSDLPTVFKSNLVLVNKISHRVNCLTPVTKSLDEPLDYFND